MFNTHKKKESNISGMVINANKTNVYLLFI